MRLIIKAFSLAAISFCCQLGARPHSVEIPQTQKDYANDPCGDPRMESMMWSNVNGKVVRVIDGDTFLMLLENRKQVLVHLVGIDAPSINQRLGSDARQFLERIIGGKKVEVWVNPSNWISKRPQPKEVTGVVYLRGADMRDANLALVRAGMARHEKAKAYTMSSHTECQYEKAEEEARTARRGLWQGSA